MTDDHRAGEDSFFEGARTNGLAIPPPPKKRASPLWARHPATAVLALSLSGWLFWDLFPQVQYFFSSEEPILLGGPGAYELGLARENRLVQVRGGLEKTVAVTESRTGAPRTVGLLSGTNLLVDRPGRGGPPLFEGRLLPLAERGTYAGAVAAMKEKGARVGDAWMVLRDGDRPRTRVLPVLGATLLVLVIAVNLMALVKFLTA